MKAVLYLAAILSLLAVTSEAKGGLFDDPKAKKKKSSKSHRGQKKTRVEVEPVEEELHPYAEENDQFEDLFPEDFDIENFNPDELDAYLEQLDLEYDEKRGAHGVDDVYPEIHMNEFEEPEMTEEEKELMTEWETHMHDFVPEDLLSMTVDPKDEQVFYYDVTEEQLKKSGGKVYIRGAYFVSDSSNGVKRIDFFVLNPDMKVIFASKKKEEGIFRFNATKEGTDSFVLNNKRDRAEKDITFAVHF